MEKVGREAIRRAEQNGIIFIDEIDKIAARGGGQGPDVSREGVQRDMLPIVEGSTVSTKHGPVKTDHILFIAAGAFSMAKPSDMVPELQGRFPIRVELEPLGKDEFLRILREPRNALTKQYVALLETEGVKIKFSGDSIEELASIAEEVNEKTENIGARRLQTVLEKLLEEISFEAPDRKKGAISINAEYVQERLKDIVKDAKDERKAQMDYLKSLGLAVNPATGELSPTLEAQKFAQELTNDEFDNAVKLARFQLDQTKFVYQQSQDAISNQHAAARIAISEANQGWPPGRLLVADPAAVPLPDPVLR